MNHINKHYIEEIVQTLCDVIKGLESIEDTPLKKLQAEGHIMQAIKDLKELCDAKEES